MSPSILPFLSQRNEQSNLPKIKKTINKLKEVFVKAIPITKYNTKREKRTSPYNLNIVSIKPKSISSQKNNDKSKKTSHQ